MILQGRLYEIAAGIADLPYDTIQQYRKLLAEQGYELPPEPPVKPGTQFIERPFRRERVGTALKARVEKVLGVKQKEGCGCADLANKMDQWGIKGCELYRDTIVSHMVANRDVLIEGLKEWLPSIWAGLVNLVPDAILRQGASWLLDQAIDEVRTRDARHRQDLNKRQKTMRKSPHSLRQLRDPPAPDPATLVPWISERPINDETPRNLMMHIWPTRNDAWKWNLDQILHRKEIFTGRRILGVATGSNTYTVEEVAEYAKDLDARVFGVKNNVKIREGATFLQMLEFVEGDHQSVTFFCHSKGARHNESFGADGSTLKPWTESMYRLCLDDMPAILGQLKQFTMTGPYRRFGNFRTPGNHRWHYSGAFYWFRNADVYTKNWKRMDRAFFAVESWPGLMFRPNEVACCFHDNCGDLYQMDYWNSAVLPGLQTLNH